MMKNKERLEIILKLIDEVQEDLRDHIEAEFDDVGLGRYSAGIDIQKLHSIKALLKMKD